MYEYVSLLWLKETRAPTFARARPPTSGPRRSGALARKERRGSGRARPVMAPPRPPLPLPLPLPLLLPLLLLPGSLGVPAEPSWYEQLTDHFSSSTATYRQRYYADERHFGGPGSPIFVIMGGEGGIPPEVGIFYPWVTEVLAAEHRALVVEPEHRYYGASLPFGEASFSPGNLSLLSPQQALADAARFVRAQQAALGCTGRGTPGYCPVLTIGGSYPGFLSAMMRLRYPDVVDMAYSASAPMKFYAQQVSSMRTNFVCVCVWFKPQTHKQQTHNHSIS